MTMLLHGLLKLPCSADEWFAASIVSNNIGKAASSFIQSGAQFKATELSPVSGRKFTRVILIVLCAEAILSASHSAKGARRGTRALLLVLKCSAIPADVCPLRLTNSWGLRHFPIWFRELCQRKPAAGMSVFEIMECAQFTFTFRNIS